MAVPTGTASLLDIQNEFGGAAPISLSEYYGVADGVPSSGTISINDFRGKSSILAYTVTGTVHPNYFKPQNATIIITDHAILSNVVNTSPNVSIILDNAVSGSHLLFGSEVGGVINMYSGSTWVQGVPTLEVYFNDVLTRTYTSGTSFGSLGSLGYYEANMSVNFGQYIGQTVKLRFVYS